MIFSKQRKRIIFLKAYKSTYEVCLLDEKDTKRIDLTFKNKLSNKDRGILELNFLNELFVEQLHFNKNMIDKIGKKFKVYIMSDIMIISLDEEKTKDFINFVEFLINKEIKSIKKENVLNSFLTKIFKQKGDKWLCIMRKNLSFKAD